MSDPDRITRPQVELIATTDEQPTPGMRVLALNHGGCLIPAVWTSQSHLDFDAWCAYPKIPRTVKERQLARLTGKEAA
jgi:hypothetical protein